MLSRLFGRSASSSQVQSQADTSASESSPVRAPPRPAWTRVTAAAISTIPTAGSAPGGDDDDDMAPSTSFIAVAEAPSHRVVVHAVPSGASADVTAVLGNGHLRLPCRRRAPCGDADDDDDDAPACPFCWTALAFAGGTAKTGLLVMVSPASFAVADVARARAVMSCGAISSLEPGPHDPTRFFTGLACPVGLRYVAVGAQQRDFEEGEGNPAVVAEAACAVRVLELFPEEGVPATVAAMPPLGDDDATEEEPDPVWAARWVRAHRLRLEQEVAAKRCKIDGCSAKVRQLEPWKRDQSVVFALVASDSDSNAACVLSSSVFVGGCFTAEFALPNAVSANNTAARGDVRIAASAADALVASYRDRQLGVDVIVGWDLLTPDAHTAVRGDVAAQYFVKNRDGSAKRTCAFDVRAPSWSMSVDVGAIALRVLLPVKPQVSPNAAANSLNNAEVDTASAPTTTAPEAPAEGGGGGGGGFCFVDCTSSPAAPAEPEVDGGDAADSSQPRSTPDAPDEPTAECADELAPAAQPAPKEPAAPAENEDDASALARHWRIAMLLPIDAASSSDSQQRSPQQHQQQLHALLVSPVHDIDDDSSTPVVATAAVIATIQRPGRVVPLVQTLSCPADDATAASARATTSSSVSVLRADATDDTDGCAWWWVSTRPAGDGDALQLVRVRQGSPALDWAALSISRNEGGAAPPPEVVSRLLHAKSVPLAHEDGSVAFIAAAHPILPRVCAPLPRLALSPQEVDQGVKGSRGIGAKLGRVFGGGKSKDEPLPPPVDLTMTNLTEHAGRVAATLAYIESCRPPTPPPPQEAPTPQGGSFASAPPQPPVQQKNRAGFQLRQQEPAPPTTQSQPAPQRAPPAPAAAAPPPPPAPAPAGEQDFDKWVARTVAPTLPTQGARDRLVAGTTAKDTTPESRLEQYRRNRQLRAEANETKDALNEAQERLQERGERIDELGRRTRDMEDGANDFASAAERYRKQQQNKKWWQF